MCARFCRQCGASVATEANFCRNCGTALAPAQKTNERTVEDRKPEQTSGSSVKGVVKVPEWNTYYPSLFDARGEQIATDEQIEFYTFWKDNLEKGIAVDIEGNLSYLFVFAYEAIFRFVENKNIDALVASFERLQKSYSNYEKVAYLDDWLADARLCLNDYEAAWQILRKTSKLRLNDVLNIRARCRDTSIDGYDLLGILGKSGLTKFGRAHREQIVNCATTYLADSHRKNGANFIEHFSKQFNLSGLTEADVAKLEAFYPKKEQFSKLKWEWQFEQRHPRPTRNETYLFSAVPFPMSSPGIDVDKKTGAMLVSQDNFVKQPRIPSVELPKIVEQALVYEIRKILRDCEKTLKGKTKRGASSD